jgi:two-component system chemotaxis sensor kinase CheA
MSDRSPDDDLILEYLAESREHLANIENDLLAMEQAGAAIDEQLVNRVFRAAHSIKGGAGFFDLVRIRELAHKTENVLDLMRSDQMTPDSENVGILLLAFDKLRELISNHKESNGADISEFVAALTGLTEDHLPAERKGTVREESASPAMKTENLMRVSAFDLDQARRAGKKVCLIAYDLIADVQRRGRTPLGVLRNLADYGTILDTQFDLDSVGTLDDEPSNKIMLEVGYASVLDARSLGRVLSLDPSHIRVIEEDALAEVKASPSVLASAEAAPVEVAPAPLRPEVAEPAAKAAQASQTSQGDTTIRLNVGLLDSLMTLAGELVLSRNQLNDAIANKDDKGIGAGAHRLSMVTSELQEAVSLTRMQPVGTLFTKFPRLVRDLAKSLGKDVNLLLEGGEVELDKSILEGLSDPLTHMVRNSVDHGIESPAARAAAGKPAAGVVTLRARHQAGQVVIEVTDDGKGVSADKVAASALSKGLVTAELIQTMADRDKLALIMLPGVSTAEKVTNVSGRGVGMDVVKTNLDKLGGKIEIDSVPGKGTSFRIKLPLTLAIIPSLLISESGERFAIPQVNVGELIRIPADQIAARIDRAGDSEVVLLRDRLVPLIHLSDALGIPRRETGAKALNVILVDTGTFEYGLVVENLHDTVEIVVKPMGRHVQRLHDYAGATILGDGKVAVILDVAGLAERTGLAGGSVAAAHAAVAEDGALGENHSLLLFHNGPAEPCAVPIELVTRVERVHPSQVDYLGGRRTMQYGGASLPLLTLHDAAPVGDLKDSQQWVVIVFERSGRPLGLLAAEPVDMIEAKVALDSRTLRQPGIAGSAILNGRTTLMLDIFELAETVRKGWPGEAETGDNAGPSAKRSGTVLVAEDSDFFRGQIKRLIEAVGYKVLAATDGQAAWELLDRNAGEVSAVATDIEMPRLDGLGLTRRIRADGRFATLPVIALSSLAADDEIARGLAAGVNEYQIKLDQDKLLESINKAVSGVCMHQSPVAA